jgi:integrase
MAGRTDQSPLLCVATEGKAMSSELNRWLRPHGITPHDLRRWFQTTLESVQAPQYLIDDLMGHKPGRVRMAYSGQMDPEQARPWVEKVESHLFASGD